MDPIGFGFEAFDAVGHFQTVDHGKPVITAGEILESSHTSGKFDGVLDLESRLADSDDVRRCFALEWARFGYGESGDADEAAAVASALVAFQAAQYRMDKLIVALTQNARFTTRASDPSAVPGTAPAAPFDAGAPMTLPSGTGGGAGSDGSPGRPMDAGQPSTPGFSVDRQRNSDWSTGYCEQVTVTNTGASAGDWTITLMIQGTLTQNWNSTMTPGADGVFRVTGADFNRHLEVGASAGFGFCASK
jgi:endoglucanase